MGSDRIGLVPSRAERSSITTTASDTPIETTNLEYEFGNTEYSRCYWVELKRVKVLFASLQEG